MRKKIIKNWQLYLLLVIPLIQIAIFNYAPMFGVTLAFKDFSIRKGILGSPWVGLKYFELFFKSPMAWRIIVNTFRISFYTLISTLPMPILLALAINEVQRKKFKKTVQMVTYAPYFISTVVMVSMIMQFLALRTGAVNNFLSIIGLGEINFMGEAGLFPHVYVWSEVWQKTGYNAIIYIAALASVDPTLHESAYIDGATRFQRIIHIDIPSITPTIIIMTIINLGRVMNVGFEKAFLMQNDLNLATSEILATYVYKVGLQNAQFSYSTAINLLNSLVNFLLIILVNEISKRVSDTSLW